MKMGTKSATHAPCSFGNTGFEKKDIENGASWFLFIDCKGYTVQHETKEVTLLTKMEERLLEKISKEEFRKRARKIKLLILDVDGVMTDGRIIYTSDGAEMKNFDVKDGHGIVMARDSGIEIAIISGRESAVTQRRAEDLKIKFVYQGVKEKEKIVNKLVDELDIGFDNVAFLGDDVIDISVMKIVGIGAAVADAHPKALEMSCWVTKNNGGRGAVRELTDAILEAQT